MRVPFANSWASLSYEFWALSLEASAVISLRTWKFAVGDGGAAAEAGLMVSEKVIELFDIQIALMTGRLGTDPVTIARSIVGRLSQKTRANRHRLSHWS